MVKKYHFYIDSLRALAIFLIVLIHVSANYVEAYKNVPFGSWLSGDLFDSFSRLGIPLFLMISGFLLLTNYQEDKIKIFIKKRFLKVFVPFLIWSAFYFFWRYFFHGEQLSLLSIFRDFVTTKSYYHLGFFYYLLSLYIATPFIYQILKNKSLIVPFLLLWFVFVSVNELLRPFGLYSRLGSEIFTSYLGIYVIGYALGNNLLPWVNKFSAKVWFLIFLVCNFLIFVGTAFLTLIRGDFVSTLYIYYTPFVFLSSIAVFLIFKNINAFEFNRKHRLTTKIIKEISLVSFGIYLIHPVVIEVLYKYVVSRTAPITYPHSLIFIPAFSVAVFVISSIIISVFKRIPLSRYIVP